MNIGIIAGLSFLLMCLTTFLGLKIDKLLKKSNLELEVVVRIELALIAIEIAVAIVNIAILILIVFS